MAVEDVVIVRLPDTTDARGSNFSLSGGWLEDGFVVRDMHISTTLPGGLRGNHYHVVRDEILVVSFTDRWSAHWDTGAGTEVRSADFADAGCVALFVPKLASHAIRNDGGASLHITAMTDGPYDPTQPDSIRREVAR